MREAPAMKKPLASFVAFSLFTFMAACGGASPVGVYDVDKKAMREIMVASMPAGAAATKEAAATLDAAVEGMSVRMELKADGTASVQTKMTLAEREMNDSSNGTWKLEGRKLTISMKKGGQDDTKVADFDGSSFAIEDQVGGKPMKLTFRRL